MNWLSSNWIWLVAFGFLAMMMLRRRAHGHRSHEAVPVNAGDGSQGREGNRHHRGCC